MRMRPGAAAGAGAGNARNACGKRQAARQNEDGGQRTEPDTGGRRAWIWGTRAPPLVRWACSAPGSGASRRQSGIKQADLLDAAGLKKSQVSDILNGKIERPPDWGVTIAMVRACLEHAKAAGRLVPPDLSDEADWQRRYFDLEQDLDTSGAGKAAPRRAGRAAAGRGDRPVRLGGPPAGAARCPAASTFQCCPRTWPGSMTRSWSGLSRRPRRAAAGSRCWWAGRRPGRPGRAGRRCGCCASSGKPWRLWHPIDPSRPEAALRELPSIGPRTVVWLNEAQFYLECRRRAGRTDRRRAAGAAARPGQGPGAGAGHALARVLGRPYRPPRGGPGRLACPGPGAAGGPGHHACPPRSLPAQLRQLLLAGDPRLAQAAEAAEDGQVIQFLAGAPELMARYRNAPPAAAALINAAIDARRLGMGVALPLAFLEAAAPGYLTDSRLGRSRRGLAGAGPGLHRRPVQGHPRPAGPHPAAPASTIGPMTARLTGWPTTLSSTAAAPAARSPPPASGAQQPGTRLSRNFPASPDMPRITACSATRHACANKPSLKETLTQRPVL